MWLFTVSTYFCDINEPELQSGFVTVNETGTAKPLKVNFLTIHKLDWLC